MVFKTSRYNSFFESRFFHACVGKTSVERFVGSLDQRCEDGALIKTDKKTSIISCDMGSSALVIKRYNYRGAIHALRQTVFGTRARRAWKNARVLQKAHIPTPQALACIEIKRHGLVAWSYIITERFSGNNLHFHLIKQRPDQAGCRQIVSALQRLIDQMGEQRITHRDLKHSNIMMNDQGQAALIDLDSMRIHRFDLVYKIKRTKDLKAFARRILTKELTVPLKTKHDESLS
jgi:serine/threonine protein kinase